jgi:ATP-binding cassette subfamily F protein uup
MSSQPPLLSLRDLSLSFGGKPLFTGLSLQIHPGSRLCLVGRNGSGKSTLLKILAQEMDFDAGEFFLQPGTKVTYLPQDLDLPEDEKILDYICRTTGLPSYEVEAMLGFLELIPDRLMQGLSGGERRRILLAKALAQNADILLLDEPTNHLDIPAIEWLEESLKTFRGALVLISHDRAFLKKVSTSTWYIDRGKLLTNAKGYGDFERWTDALLLEEERHLTKLTARLRLEEEWVHRGVTARRKRNQGRLRLVQEMRNDRRSRELDRPKQMEIASLAPEAGSKMVIEAHNLTKSFGDKVIVKGFSTRILRGDRIGVVGPNGSGKTTLVKLLLKQMPPDEGRSRLGTNVELIYFDQMRDSLQLNETLWKNLCPTGGDQVCVGGQYRHVVSYLKDFLFSDNQIRGQASILSGGEKNRLALAKAFIQPGNLLVLDEPTNDLDMDTLDLLQELLSDFEGTLIIVSHDRDFLDKLTTSIIAVEGDGFVQEYVGGYWDYMAQRKLPNQVPSKLPKAKSEPLEATGRKLQKQADRKVTYNEKREYEVLPTKMEHLIEEIKVMEGKLEDPAFYRHHPQEFVVLTERLQEAKVDLEKCEERWLELADKIE